MLDSLIEPSKKIKEGYNALIVTDDDGKTVQGLKVRETDAELVLRTQDDKEVVIPKAKIDDRQDAKTSLMPGNQVDELSRQELIDLTRFLSELGKEGPYALDQRRVARRWETPEKTPVALTLLNRQGTPVVLDGQGPLQWSPLYSTVDGTIPLRDVTSQRFGGNGQLVGFVRVKLDVKTAGKIGLKLNSTKGLALWVDGVGEEPREILTRDLAAGTHTLTFSIEMTDRTEPLSLELVDIPNSPGRTSFRSASN
ncbi:MAG: hypothetical protein QM811_01085 [Pirellulales bacterium]